MNIIITSPHLGMDWISMQGNFIKRYTPHPYKYLPIVVHQGTSHIEALGKCLDAIRVCAKSGDLCVVLDSDAWPCSKAWIGEVRNRLSYGSAGYEFIAVQRLEAHEMQKCAHPCFVAWEHGTKIEFEGHPPANNPHVKGWEKRHWYPLNRTNRTVKHKRLFSIYGDIVYHHGAGSRSVRGEDRFKNAQKYRREFWEDPVKFVERLR